MPSNFIVAIVLVFAVGLCHQQVSGMAACTPCQPAIANYTIAPFGCNEVVAEMVYGPGSCPTFMTFQSVTMFGDGTTTTINLPAANATIIKHQYHGSGQFVVDAQFCADQGAASCCAAVTQTVNVFC
eukprot:m.6800 g.6800  ORF g.6800 m.6800 type:complete len:127 (+) comp5194_c0_seq1:332-712(+)